MRKQLIRIKEVMERTKLGKSTIYKYIKMGMFPKPIKLGTRYAAWVESEIDAWIEGHIARRDNELD